ncbi:glycoside hydrolase family 3 N-terminal domain-containing protein [Saccharibacillus sp. CPCC 101409]|uniref:glycoside hydrolase family 3 N-terminal domain-containing protein n=1 Tax=Saccharibacillus sp. CPCC 101409 TaxID=3058041 RepID=UPI0026725817|nr:glycoside hydrolase family 3 N-terminal domain-containing protein [Saccharibacillus sp. CPCC 101409]MDO3410306.1 glycoside hydrolase family 3 N-terminal domain-containing protein [Saccharibacillus sp. CPCC 101409]
MTNDTQTARPWMDAALPPAERAELLLAAMNAREKVGQLIQPFGWMTYSRHEGKAELTENFKERVRRGDIGSLYGTLRADPWTGVTLETGLSPAEGAEAVNEIQRYAVEHSRLGIPILIGEECSHGHMAIGATVFPVPLNIGSAWNPELYRRMCRAVAAETRAQGGAVTYSPVLDVVRDPRWGRTEECFGEDPFLIGELAVASVEGLQGESLDAEDSVGATLKHFAGYGASEGGRNAGPVHMGWRELIESDLYPFERAVRAGAASIMPAYNEIDGVPCTTNERLLDGILRGEWGFDGPVITDCGAIDMLASGHDTAEDGEDAAVQSIRAGIDMEMSGEMFGRHLLAAYEGGRLEPEVLELAAKRVLTLKFRLGLFERPYADAKKAAEVIGCDEHKRLARELAAESVVLLKNDGALLPLPNDIGSIAVIGPNADRGYNQLGDYTSPQPQDHVATVLGGVRARFGGDEARVLYAPGCRVRGDSREGFARALEIAARADAVVMVMGGSSARDFGEGTIDLRTGASMVTGEAVSDMDCGEGIDRMTLGLSGVQSELIREVHALGKPVVLVYIGGRPVVEPWADEQIPAILQAGYPGQEGGHAIADILFGDVNPSGRLTISVPKHVGQLPVYYNGKRSRGKRYLEDDSKPRYAFGYGLSYTSFEYGEPVLEQSRIAQGGRTTVSVAVTNTGERAGAEVAQLYITDVVSAATRPGIQLKGFRKVWLEPGESRTVEFEVGTEQLRYIGPDLAPVVEPGLFRVSVGRSAVDTRSADLIVTD